MCVLAAYFCCWRCTSSFCATLWEFRKKFCLQHKRYFNVLQGAACTQSRQSLAQRCTACKSPIQAWAQKQPYELQPKWQLTSELSRCFFNFFSFFILFHSRCCWQIATLIILVVQPCCMPHPNSKYMHQLLQLHQLYVFVAVVGVSEVVSLSFFTLPALTVAPLVVVFVIAAVVNLYLWLCYVGARDAAGKRNAAQRVSSHRRHGVANLLRKVLWHMSALVALVWRCVNCGKCISHSYR